MIQGALVREHNVSCSLGAFTIVQGPPTRNELGPA